MSIKRMAEVWEFGPQDQGELLLLLALADFANDAGECWPSMATLAAKARIHERSAQKIIRRLEASGWVEIETGNGRGGCNRYTIKPRPKATPAQSHPPRETPALDAETPALSAETPAQDTPEPSRTIIEPSEEPPIAPHDAKAPKKERLPEGWVLDDDGVEYAHSLQLNDAEIKEIAHDFFEYWSERRDAGSRKSERGWKQTWRNRCLDVAPKFRRNRSVAGQAFPGNRGRGSSIASIVARRQSGDPH